MRDYLVKVDITGAGDTYVGMPNDGVIVAVFADAPISLAWKYNNEEGPLMTTPGLVWQLMQGWAPAPFSSLKITTTAATHISIVVRK